MSHLILTLLFLTFPQLMTASLIEYSEDHLTGISYISTETLRKQKNELEKEQKAA